MKTTLLDKIKELKAAISSPDAAEKIERMQADIDHWGSEANQMLEDKENKIITAVLCGASMLIGFILGVIII